MTKDEAKSWSQFSNLPIFYGDMCYWKGWHMTKPTAYVVACVIFMKIPITKKQKQELYDKSLACDLDFDIKEYGVSFIDAIHRHIWNEMKIKTEIPEWTENSSKVFQYFFIENPK